MESSPTTEGPAEGTTEETPTASVSVAKRASASATPSSQPRKSVNSGEAGAPTGSPPLSQPGKNVVAGGATEGSPPSSPPRKSVVAEGATEGAASQPRKSIIAGGGTEGSASQPRKSIIAGGGTEGSASQSRKSIIAGGGTEGSASQPRKSVINSGATEGPAASSQPRKSVIAGAAGTPAAAAGTDPGSPATPASSQPRKSVVAGSTEGSSPTSSQHPQASASSTPSKEVAGEPVKKTPPTGWDYSQPLPNRFFRPSLTDLCFPVLAKNFARFPGFGNLPADERLRVVSEISLDLPLKLAADLIPEEPYWKRRVQSKWRNCDINAHGRSWKQLFFERNLAEALERFDRTVDKESSLVEIMKTSASYVHNLDIVELPSHVSFLELFNLLERTLVGLRVSFGNPKCGWNYNRQKWGIKRSDCLSLSAALSVTCTLTSLHLSGNRIDPEKMGILASGLMANPTVVDLDLSSNFLSDDGVREVAKVVKAKNSVLGMLSLARNRITAQGCVYLAECEDVNKSLVSLNLCFNQFGDLGGKRIIDWANNNTSIQKLSLESCDIGEDSAQSFVRLMHNTNSALTSINMSGNHSIGVKNGELLLTGLEAGKLMKELWISNSKCGEELEKKILTFLVERLFGRTCFHHPGVRLEEVASKGEEKKEDVDQEARKTAEEKVEEQQKLPEGYEEDEEEKKQREEREAAKIKAEEEAAATAVAIAEAEALVETQAHAEEELIHVGHGHDEACTLECSHLVGLPSTKPPPEPVVYPETAYVSRDAQAAIKQIQDSKPYWGLAAIKDLKEKGPE